MSVCHLWISKLKKIPLQDFLRTCPKVTSPVTTHTVFSAYLISKDLKIKCNKTIFVITLSSFWSLKFTSKPLSCQILHASKMSSQCSHLTFQKSNLQHLPHQIVIHCQPLFVMQPKCILTCKYSLKQPFHWPPSATWVGSWINSHNLTWPDLVDFGVFIPCGHVDSHLRHEVERGFPEAVMENGVRQQCCEPVATESWDGYISGRKNLF